jgi:pSer/pThr/pTyr-binding forkhead associated (FHA) protein
MFGRLYIEEGGRPARMIELSGVVTIGRTADNDIVLESDGVSHCHAMLLAQPDGVTLLDLGSTFGTFVDAVQALPDEPMRLPNGAQISIGRALLRYAKTPTAHPNASNGRAPHARAQLVAPSLNTRFQGIAPGQPFPAGRYISLLVWVGAPISSDQWQSSRALRWNADLSAPLALRVRVRAASLAWMVVAEQPMLLAEPWGSAQIARYQILARRAERTKLSINVEHAESHSPVQQMLLGVHAVASDGAAISGPVACRKCGTTPRAGAKFCPECGSPAILTS